MSYGDNENKIAVVVNRGVPVGRLANALAHCCVGLAERAGAELELLDYECPAGGADGMDGWTARISRWPVVVLAAKNSGQLARLAREAREEELPFNCFTAAMIGADAATQMRQTREDAAPEYWAVAVFGGAEELRPLTKRFSLFTGGTSAPIGD